ncbi:MAG TPA: hypothetical protein VK745_03780 [Polyangiaceae bacterium]|nr:hypothetical protein [Polyangiaceae bacterium]
MLAELAVRVARLEERGPLHAGRLQVRAHELRKAAVARELFALFVDEERLSVFSAAEFDPRAERARSARVERPRVAGALSLRAVERNRTALEIDPLAYSELQRFRESTPLVREETPEHAEAQRHALLWAVFAVAGEERRELVGVQIRMRGLRANAWKKLLRERVDLDDPARVHGELKDAPQSLEIVPARRTRLGGLRQVALCGFTVLDGETS